MLIVSGNWNNESNAGVRNANANNSPENSNNNISFRSANCAPVATCDPRIAVIVRAHHAQVPYPEVGIKHKTIRRQRVAQRNLKPEPFMPHTYKHLFAKVHDFENLYRAYERARKGKRTRPDVVRFTANLGENLAGLRDRIQSLEWRSGVYREKVIYEPKERIIRIAPFSDRIVHQSLCAVIAPLFEETFVYDTYACRVGKGTHKAIDRVTGYLRKPGIAYALKLDLRKFFDSIPHGLVMRELEWRIADARVLELCRRILGSYTSDAESFPAGFGLRGLPIGNLTSQWFANIVGSRLDYHVKHVLKCRHAARYMDDVLLLGESRGMVQEWREKLERYIAEMGLVVNPKTRIFPVKTGVPFLGHRIWSTHRRVLRPNVVAGRGRMRRMLMQMKTGVLPGAKAIECLRSWFAHLGHADTYRLRLKLWREAKPVLGEFVC